ncbi:hypothetical protein [Burkholderia sp. SRS-W-2-2016]|uniref:hypothetical protein n=1 Tax=Burkholderia sp. SRS-W-2-2016 TaxID=1926878 RepID=UPI0015BEE804|nr:hypothetical protein [Burkholderia sp. SRS-W-2-2016]
MSAHRIKRDWVCVTPENKKDLHLQVFFYSANHSVSIDNRHRSARDNAELILRRFAPTRFDLAAQVRQQPAGDGLRPVRRVRSEFGFVFEVDDDGTRHHPISPGVIHAI